MKIKRYRLKNDITEKDLIIYGAKEGSWQSKNYKYSVSKDFYIKEYDFDFSIHISFNQDIVEWNDYDNVLVLDNDWCQPYTPFYYDNYGKEISNFPVLEICIEKYNEFMDGLPFLEEDKDNK